MAKTQSKTSLLVQLIVAALVLAWFSYDFFHTLFNGLTFTLRFDSQIAYSQFPIPFVMAVAIKLAVVTFFVWVFKDCIKKLKNK